MCGSSSYIELCDRTRWALSKTEAFVLGDTERVVGSGDARLWLIFGPTRQASLWEQRVTAKI